MTRGRGISGRVMAAAVQTLLVLSLVFFAAYEAVVYPKAWVRVSAYANRELAADSTLSFRLHLEDAQVRLASRSGADGAAARAQAANRRRRPGARGQPGVSRRFQFGVEGDRLVATEYRPGMLLVYGQVYRRDTAQEDEEPFAPDEEQEWADTQPRADWHSVRPIRCYLGAVPQDVKGLLQRDGDYWMEVAVRPREAPIPLRLAVRDGGGLRILGELD